ncbi:hypothetical protein CC80DRAFT_479340 [Byssothecium circinans]|uniref:DUF3176 domain-containing protein n=1 Tax=Byssothecium circinans TaxID=147558 RepID=A0A6A5TKS5_9PLEO|nr:hypothetical protein CC80DRAFT_479340 [Byssothecium circinans]
MARTPNSQQWPPYPHIPIYLETSDNSGTARSYRSIAPIAPSPEIRTEKRSIQYLAAASTQFTSIPTPASPVSPATQFTNLSPIWPIPEPLPQPPPEIAQQPPRRPALRFFPSSRPRVQLGVPVDEQSEKAQKSPPHPGRRSRLGLGIEDVLSPQTPISIPSSDTEMDKRSSNIAQRIEEGLWRYSLSGNVIKRWLLEIICWLVSAVSMATIVGFLIYYKNKKIPNWPGSLTLNAFIAILSKISGAALILPVSEALGQLKWSWFQGHSKTMWDFEIFDNASRGPWGAFLLLIRTKGRALAALGAIITLFSLALDPFFQQVVDFPDRWSLQGTGAIPRVVWYAPNYLAEFRGGTLQAQSDAEIFSVAKKFFYDNGTQPIQVGNGTRAELPISCPTGNCTWAPYKSLGVCSKCVDVSNMLTFQCMDTTVDWIANLTGSGTESTYPNGTVCGYFFNAKNESGPPIMMSGYLTTAVQSEAGSARKGEVLLSRLLPLVSSPSKRPIFGGSVHFKNVRNPLLDVMIVSAANGLESVLRNQTPIAQECLLSWCVKTIKSTYFQAMYEEEILETVENGTAGPYPWVATPLKNGFDTYYRENVTIQTPAVVNGSDAVGFGMQNSTFYKIDTVFNEAFPSFYTTTGAPSAKPILRYRFYITGLPYTRNLDFNPWISNNVTLHMEKLATAITNVMRSNPTVDRVIGDAFSMEAYVLVRWEWLILPLSLLLLSLLFLVATMKKTSKEGVWKTSAIATLLYGLPDDMQKKITATANEGTPRAKAKELKVKLHATQGWRVSGNLFSPVTPKPKQYQPPLGWI